MFLCTAETEEEEEEEGVRGYINKKLCSYINGSNRDTLRFIKLPLTSEGISILFLSSFKISTTYLK